MPRKAQHSAVLSLIDPGTSHEAAVRKLRREHLSAAACAAALGAAARAPAARRRSVGRAVIAAKPRIQDRIRIARAATEAQDGATAGAVAKAFRDARAERHLVAAVAVLPPAQAGLLLDAHFGSGGTIRPFVEWFIDVGALTAPGAARRTERSVRESELAAFARADGIAVPDAARAVLSALESRDRGLGDLIDDFGDLVGKLGRKWSSFVNGLIQAGKRVGEVVAAVLTQMKDATAEGIRKLSKALAEAGQDTAEILSEVWGQAKELLRECLTGLLNAKKALSEILAAAWEGTGDLLRGCISALRDANKPLRQILAAVADLAADAFRVAVAALAAAAADVKRIVRWSSQLGRDVARRFVDALQAAGTAVREIARTAVRLVGEALDAAVRAVAAVADGVHAIVEALADQGARIGPTLRTLRAQGHRFCAVIDEASTFSTALAVRVTWWAVKIAGKVGTILAEAIADGAAAVGRLAGTIARAARTKATAVIDWAVTQERAVLRAVAGALGLRYWRSVLDRLRKAGAGLLDVVVAAADAAKAGALDAARHTWRALVKAGALVRDVLGAVWRETREFMEESASAVAATARRMSDLLEELVHLEAEAFWTALGAIASTARAMWEVVKWAALRSVERLQHILEKALAAGIELWELTCWFSRQSLETAAHGISAVVAIAGGVAKVLEAVFLHGANLRTILAGLRQIGRGFGEVFNAVKEFGVKAVKRTYRTLLKVGVLGREILEELLGLGKDAFVATLKLLLEAGTFLVVDVFVWSLNKLEDVSAWVLEVALTVGRLAWKLLAAVLKLLSPAALERVGEIIARWGREKIDWFRNEILVRALQLKKLALLLSIAAALVALAASVVTAAPVAVAVVAVLYFGFCGGSALEALDKRMDARNWPPDFAAFRASAGNKLFELHPVSDSEGYVVISDVHRESQADVDAGFGHFFANRDLLVSVLRWYLDHPQVRWTLVLLGDDEDFWLTADVAMQHHPLDKIVPIIETNRAVYDLLAEFLAKGRLVKLLGNHDDVWRIPPAVDRLREQALPDIGIREYAVIPSFVGGKSVLLMHGHQADRFNCQANRELGKFLTDVGAEAGEFLVKADEYIQEHFGPTGGFETLADFMHLGAQKDDWVRANRWISEPLASDEKVALEATRDFDCHLVIGHTHHPRFRNRGDGRLYLNTATAGTWEGCIWTLELARDSGAANSATLKQWFATTGAPEAQYEVTSPTEEMQL